MADTTTTTAQGDALPNTTAQKGQGGLLKWTASVPSNVMSMLNPFGDAEEGKEGSKPEKKDKAEKDTDAQAQQSTPKRTSMFASIFPSALLGGDSTPKKDAGKEDEGEDEETMFAEPDTRSNSDDGSRDGSMLEPKAKKSKCAKTSYSMCHPAPTSKTKQRLHRRPRSMMQLHKLSADRRPRPAFEVIPSANFSVRLTKAIAKVFKAKHSICPGDLVVMRAERYATTEDEGNEEQDERDIIALICRGRPGDAASVGGKARICLPEGMEWEAYPTPNGGYEFFCTDEHGLGLTVRWVMKKGKDGTKPTDTMQRKFNFSTISPKSRRHPVIATMGRSGLDINDTYKMPDAGATTPSTTPRRGSTFLADAMDDEEVPMQQQEVCETDAKLREIIVMTGIWVAFKEGWSPFYKYDDKDKEAALSVQRSPSMQPYSPAKSSTFNINSPVSTPPGSPVQAPLQKRNSIKSIGSGIARTGSLLRRGSNDNRRSTVSVPDGEEEAMAFDPQQRTSRSRANSNSTVLVHRAASNRRRKNNEAAWRPDMLTAQQEAANEDASSSIHARSPAGSRKDSLARPILPPPQSTSSAVAQSDGSAEEEVPATPTKTKTKRMSVQQPVEKRVSSATTATASSRSEGIAKPQVVGKQRKAKSGWRRLLCGSGQDI